MNAAAKQITAEEIIAACIMGDESISHVLDLTFEEMDDLMHVTSRINHEAREWNWSAVKKLLNAAYAAIGAKNPGTGYDYHCGNHPVQAEIERLQY